MRTYNLLRSHVARLWRLRDIPEPLRDASAEIVAHMESVAPNAQLDVLAAAILHMDRPLILAGDVGRVCAEREASEDAFAKALVDEHKASRRVAELEEIARANRTQITELTDRLTHTQQELATMTRRAEERLTRLMAVEASRPAEEDDDEDDEPTSAELADGPTEAEAGATPREEAQPSPKAKGERKKGGK